MSNARHPTRRRNWPYPSGMLPILSWLSLLLLSSSSAVFSQSTWSGLHFGMSVEDARKQLTGEILNEKQPPLNPSAFIFTLKPVPIGAARGEPHIIFENGRLIRVVLVFSMRAEGCFDKPDRDLYARQIMTIDAIGEACTRSFREKYGKPINETGAWPSSTMVGHHLVTKAMNEKFESERAWKSGGQMIRISLSMICDSLSLLITYDPEASGPRI